MNNQHPLLTPFKKTKEHEYFQGRNGMVFYRSTAKTTPGKSKKERKMGQNSGGQNPSYSAVPRRMPQSCRRNGKAGAFVEQGQVPPAAKKSLRFDPSEDKVGKTLKSVQTKDLPKEDHCADVEEDFVALPAKQTLEYVDPSEEKFESSSMLAQLDDKLRNETLRQQIAVLRQSLTIAELEKLFEDDTTESFENIEKTLKTPMRRPIPRPRNRPVPIMNKLYGDDEEDVEEKLMVEEVIVEEEKEDIDEEETVVEEEDTVVEEEETVVEEEEISVLERSVSMVDLGSMKMKKTKEVVLSKSTSESHLSDSPLVRTNWRLTTMQKLEQLKEEQENLNAEVTEILKRKDARRKEFIATWGASPATMNRQRKQAHVKQPSPQPAGTPEHGRMPPPLPNAATPFMVRSIKDKATQALISLYR